ncbi:hypothetical protein B0H17DRAFT_580073 [Mycena rosella]|uniref:BHLH domain-containing protein n=1 Tax=Mycena rosella TaxID=1033263 RepID=A0AAD7FJQ6_MYCRO|nr:hypothetical protein B0H17DRAFT_580073 [Mycena rosella]
MYDPLSSPLSCSDTSADSLYQASNSSSANSSSRGNSFVQRQVRYTPTPSPTSFSGRRHRRGRSHSDMNLLCMENLAQNRKEVTRRRRIEAAATNCAKLNDVLPISNQKSSKVSLLDRGGGSAAAQLSWALNSTYGNHCI